MKKNIVLWVLSFLFCCNMSTVIVAMSSQQELQQVQFMLNELLMRACDAGNLEKVKEYVGLGADVNSRDKHDDATPLLFACQHNYTDIMKYLLAHGADVNA